MLCYVCKHKTIIAATFGWKRRGGERQLKQGKYPRAVSMKKGHERRVKNQKTKPKLNQSDNYHFEPSIFYMHNPNNFYPKRLFSNFAAVVVSFRLLLQQAACHITFRSDWPLPPCRWLLSLHPPHPLRCTLIFVIIQDGRSQGSVDSSN